MDKNIELAKRLLEAKGYDVNESNHLRVRKVLMDLNVEFSVISENDGVVYVTNDEPYEQGDLKNVWSKLSDAESAGFEDQRHTMWFSFTE